MVIIRSCATKGNMSLGGEKIWLAGCLVFECSAAFLCGPKAMAICVCVCCGSSLWLQTVLLRGDADLPHPFNHILECAFLPWTITAATRPWTATAQAARRWPNDQVKKLSAINVVFSCSAVHLSQIGNQKSRLSLGQSISPYTVKFGYTSDNVKWLIRYMYMCVCVCVCVCVCTFL